MLGYGGATIATTMMTTLARCFGSTASKVFSLDVRVCFSFTLVLFFY